MKKQPERTAQTREDLMLAFCALYAQAPIDKITVNQITRLAGYNRSTFYQYFTDIYALLDAIEGELLTEIKRNWNADPDAWFAPDLSQLLALFADREPYLKALLGEYGSAHFLAQLKRELPLAAMQEAFPAQKELVPYLMEFHLSTSLSLCRVWMQNQKDIPAEQLLETIHRLYTGGISSFTG